MKQIRRRAKVGVNPAASLGEAVFADKEIWKNEPGNRYTPEELCEMERYWDVRLEDPHMATCRSAD